MYRMYGQIFAPAISALPPSVVVVCHGVAVPWMAKSGACTMTRCLRPTRQGLLLHFLHPWRSDTGRYDSREGIDKVE